MSLSRHARGSSPESRRGSSSRLVGEEGKMFRDHVWRGSEVALSIITETYHLYNQSDSSTSLSRTVVTSDSRIENSDRSKIGMERLCLDMDQRCFRVSTQTWSSFCCGATSFIEIDISTLRPFSSNQRTQLTSHFPSPLDFATHH